MKNVVLLFYPSAWPAGQRGRIPYALLYLERVVRDLGVEVVLVDEQVDGDYLPILDRLKHRLLLAGVSAMTGDQIVGGIRFSRAVRERCGAPIVWGGWHPTLLPEQVLSEPYVDYVVLGQGETPFRILTEHLLAGREPVEAPGVGYRREGEFVVNSPGAFQDFNRFPELDLGLIDVRKYVFKNVYSERCIGYFCSHGCPFSCAFCCVANVYGRRWYRRRIDEIIRHLHYFKESAGIDSITFDDDNFFVNKSFVLDLCRRMIEEKLDLLWDTSAHAASFLKNFTAADVSLIRQAGCRQIYIGAESGDQEILDLISKGSKVEDNLEFVRVLKQHGITPMLSTMVCFPVDSGREVELTVDMIRKARLLDESLRARIFFYTPYPGTELYQKALSAGFHPPRRLEDWPMHTLRKFRAPWAKKNYPWLMEVFANFYLPMSNPFFFRKMPSRRLRALVFVVNQLFFPTAYLRFRMNFFKFPFEAWCFLCSLRIFNKLAGTRYCLGYESYLD